MMLPMRNVLWMSWCYSDNRDLHGMTHYGPTRRSSDLLQAIVVEIGDIVLERLVAVDVLQLLLQGVGLGAALHLVEHAADLGAQAGAGPAQVRLQDLADVHAARHAQRVQHDVDRRSEEHTSELQSLMRISYAVFCL